MNPADLPSNRPARARKPSFPRRLATAAGELIVLLFSDPFAGLRRRRVHVDEGPIALRLFRGLVYRLAFVPVVCILFIAALVYAGTHPVIPSDATAVDPSAQGLYFERVVLTSDDGTHIDGWLVPVTDAGRILSQGDDDLGRRRPAVILAHGYGQTRQEMLPLIKPLHDHGWIVLALGLRGSGSAMPAGQTFGINESLDIKAGIEMLRRRPLVDGNRLAIIGRGTGANAALMAADRDRHLAAIVLEDAETTGESAIARYVGPHIDGLEWMVHFCKWAFDIGYGVDADDVTVAHYAPLQAVLSCHVSSSNAGRPPTAPAHIGEIMTFLSARLSPAPPPCD
jgi:hypothetical protein